MRCSICVPIVTLYLGMLGELYLTAKHRALHRLEDSNQKNRSAPVWRFSWLR